MPARKTALVLSPETLVEFARIDPNLPSLVTRAGIVERTQEYRYALASLFCGLTAFGCVIGGFVYLTIRNHPKSAGGLLATGVLSLIGGFIRSRLRKVD